MYTRPPHLFCCHFCQVGLGLSEDGTEFVVDLHGQGSFDGFDAAWEKGRHQGGFKDMREGMFNRGRHTAAQAPGPAGRPGSYQSAPEH
jgi:hypothetical protein